MNYQDIYAKEINALINNEWRFLYDNYPVIEREYKHRTELKPLKVGYIIDKIKAELLNKLGYIAVFYFIQLFFSIGDYKNPYRNIDKVLLVLYQLISGKSLKDMNEYIPYASFYDIQYKFWDKEKEKIGSEVNKKLESMFSNIKLRILSSKIYNPVEFKGVTLFLDGHDSRINYENLLIDNFNLYSYKFEGTGVRTQFCTDINGFILYVSASKYCKNNVDGDMFLKMKLEKKINEADCIAFDGGYYYYIDRFIENSGKIGLDLNRSNFLCPFRKEKNIDLTAEQVEYNETFGSFRSTIETVFADIGNKFKMFSNNKKITRVTNVINYNLKFKTACLLYNIKKFTDKYNIVPDELHKQWYNDNFDIKYKDEVDDNENLFTQNFNNLHIADISSKHNDIIEAQDRLINLSITSHNDVAYEVEKIIRHQKDQYDNNKYFVKWKGYSSFYNSWVEEEDFNENDIIIEYWNKQMEKDMEI